MQTVPISDLLARPIVPVDVFVRLGGTKFVCIAKAGSAVDGLKKYQDRKVENCYVRIEDYVHLVRLAISEASSLAGSTNTTETERLMSLASAMSSVYREIEAVGFNEMVFTHVKLINHSTFRFLVKSPRCVEAISNMNNVSEDGVKHSMMVSLIAAMIGIAHEWTKPGTIESLALGGFLHDIGQTRLPKEIMDTPPAQLSKTDLVIYNSHPDVGAQMLAQVKTVPDDVVLMVQQHHEFANSTGYPRGLNDNQISPLARVVALANVVVDSINPASQVPMNTQIMNIIQHPDLAHRGRFNRDAIKALHRLFSKEKIQGTG